MQNSSLFLKKQCDRRIKRGHLWIYSNEVDTNRSPLKAFSNGEQVIVQSAQGTTLGTALMEPHELICGRLLDREINIQLDTDFFIHKISNALKLRELNFASPFYRLVYGDSDLLPGVIIDRFDDYYVIQFTLSGMAYQQDTLIAALESIVKPKGIAIHYLISETKSPMVLGELPDTIYVEENSCRFSISPLHGQKTGWFYDHRVNRKQLQQFVAGKSVLDVFSYVGAWGLQSAVAGARSVTCVDSSQPALDCVIENANLNNCDQRVDTIRGRAVEVLKALANERKKFDIVVLDPPAFIKKRKDQKAGEAAYRHINELALQLLENYGVLVSASCSMPLTNDTLTEIIRGASLHRNRHAQLFYLGSQGPDHPVHPAIPETRYLKAQFYFVVNNKPF